MKHIKLYEEFVNEALNLNSEQFRKYVIDTVAKKCPWAEITEETSAKSSNFDSITFDDAVLIYWTEGPANQTNSMIRVQSSGKWQKPNPNTPDRKRFGQEVNKATGWDKQENGVKNLISILKTNSANSPKNQ
jgi:hypothetical protein